MAGDADAAVAGMRSAIDSGTLRLEPGTAAQCAAECDVMASALIKLISRLQSSTTVDGFGILGTGGQLAAGFGGKATEAIAHVREQAEIAARMADNFRAIEAKYVSQEQSNAASMNQQASSFPGGSGQ